MKLYKLEYKWMMKNLFHLERKTVQKVTKNTKRRKIGV